MNGFYWKRKLTDKIYPIYTKLLHVIKSNLPPRELRYSIFPQCSFAHPPNNARRVTTHFMPFIAASMNKQGRQCVVSSARNITASHHITAASTRSPVLDAIRSGCSKWMLICCMIWTRVNGFRGASNFSMFGESLMNARRRPEKSRLSWKCQKSINLKSGVVSGGIYNNWIG